jgi:hypothetical protein
LPELSFETPNGSQKVDKVPLPSKKGVELPFPANVLTFQPKLQLGSAVNPEVVHKEGTEQGVAAAGVPPGQKYPGLQKVAFAKEVDPAIHPYPGEAVQGPEQVKEVKPVEAPK